MKTEKTAEQVSIPKNDGCIAGSRVVILHPDKINPLKQINNNNSKTN